MTITYLHTFYILFVGEIKYVSGIYLITIK